MLRMTAVEAWAEGFEAREAAAGGELPGLFASAIRGAQNAADQPPVELNTALSARRMHFEMRRGFLEHAHTELLALATALKADLDKVDSDDDKMILFARINDRLASMFGEDCRPMSPSLKMLPDVSDVDDDDEPPPPASPTRSSPPPAGSSPAGSSPAGSPPSPTRFVPPRTTSPNPRSFSGAR